MRATSVRRPVVRKVRRSKLRCLSSANWWLSVSSVPVFVLRVLLMAACARWLLAC